MMCPNNNVIRWELYFNQNCIYSIVMFMDNVAVFIALDLNTLNLFNSNIKLNNLILIFIEQ